jgi:hypothetical protein
MINLLLFCFTDITDILKVWKKKKGMKNVMKTCVLVSKTALIIFVHNSFIVSVFEIL